MKNKSYIIIDFILERCYNKSILLDGVMQMATRKTLTEIKQHVQDHLGEKVILRTNKGRKKVKTKEGVLLETYPAVFVVRIDPGLESERKISYSYSDILTETVEVMLTENQERIYVS